jgi:hypothetical protein
MNVSSGETHKQSFLTFEETSTFVLAVSRGEGSACVLFDGVRSLEKVSVSDCFPSKVLK